jgi:hypothetical protein
MEANGEVDGFEFGVRDLDTGWVGVWIELAGAWL